jgi:orotidine-5'-phosphate decarboxylase
MNLNSKRIFVALDFPSLEKASALASALGDKVGFKVGLELNIAAGTPAVIEAIGRNVFLDLKLHDIPNTVAGAVKAAAQHRVKMLNLHCLGDKPMMEAARSAADQVFVETGNYRPLILGVTILTSHDRAGLTRIGIDPNLSMEKIVEKLTILAVESGLDGVVCSPREIVNVRSVVCEDGFIVVTPGIRRKTDPADDQKRTMSATEAIHAGASFLVIGRPITQAADPVGAAEEFIAEVEP